MSTRFAPLSYERPKGLMRVCGEILVERQIRQLREAGVGDICLVVGYKQEQFFYLRERFGVDIAVNPDYATKNSISSLYLARGRLADTFVCSSDNYYEGNPFLAGAEGPYYTAQYQRGQTDEWCLDLAADGRIDGVRVGGADAWCMVGHAFFDRAFSREFARAFEEDYALPGADGWLWEELIARHAPEWPVRALKLPEGAVRELDSVDDARALDPRFMDEVDSEVLDHITGALGCARSEIRNLYPLKDGLTNMSSHFATDAGEFVYRSPGVGTELLVDRAAEAAAQEVARGLGLDGTYVFQDPDEGWKVSRFIPGASHLDPHDDWQLGRAMGLARALHGSGAEVGRAFDFYEEGRRYGERLEAAGAELPEGYSVMAESARALRELAAADGAPVCLCHNDFFELNLLLDGEGGLHLIDWEYAGMSDYASDYGTFVVTCRLSREEADRALELYFEREPSAAERRHNYAFVALAGWCWYVWALLKEAEGDNVGQWLYVYYSYASEYLPLALSMYGSGEGEAQS